ncbi:hypothetical protein RHSIM_Rhsim07G0005400 [Rhododendron simsii]|uniref:Pentatricopeptide repeat-containing protein n=1 Tax=Rhododendron simsii TaxID=118357 RepID=A0A834GM96_RHOSS|nr:hypothetical protein RHSIM_Rhsim07G0005400 [Rhododendron simsii]
MGTIPQLHPINPSPLQNPLTTKKPRSHSTTFSILKVAETQLSASLPPFHCLNGYDEPNSLKSVKIMHAQIAKMAKDKNSDAKMQYLITSYLIFGDFRSSAMVFFLGFAQNYLHWNSFVKEFTSFGGDPFEILEVFCQLHNKRVSFGSRVLTIVLKLCANVRVVWLGMEVHASLIKKGFDRDVYSKCALMNFYGCCWGIEYANQAFDEMPDQEGLLWNEAVLVNLRNEKWVEALQLFKEMQFSFVKANSVTLAKIVQACGKVEALDLGKQIHGYIIRSALESNVWVCNSLIGMYSRNNSLELARAVFDLMEKRNLSSWNSIISSYTALGHLHDAQKLFSDMESCNMDPDIITWNSLMSGHFHCGLYREVLILLQRMQAAGLKPSSSSITSGLQAISELSYLSLGKELHCYVVRNGFSNDLYVGTSLLDMYVKNDSLTYAQAVFDSMMNRNIFAWNSLISGYSFAGQFEDAIQMLNRMERAGIKPDLVTYNGLVFGYSTWGRNKEALSMIHHMKVSGLTPNVVTWTSLISGCTQKGNFMDALDFSIQMQEDGIKPNSATISTLLRACASLSSLQKGKEIHCMAIRNGFMEEVYVNTALIDMYAKCGSLASAYEVFGKIQDKTLASWNCMIMGFSIYSQGKEAILLFNEMQEAGIQPDAITFTALLSGCKHSGLVNEGWKYFDSMKEDHNIIPTIEHYSCMVDLLGKCGYLDEAWDFIERMPITPDANVWGALLGSCRIHGNLKLAEIAAKNLFKLEPHNPANYLLMMNLYAASGRWEDVDNIRDLMGVKMATLGQWNVLVQKSQVCHQLSQDGQMAHHREMGVNSNLSVLMTTIPKIAKKPMTGCDRYLLEEKKKKKEILSYKFKQSYLYSTIPVGQPKMEYRIINKRRMDLDIFISKKYDSILRPYSLFLSHWVGFPFKFDRICNLIKDKRLILNC